MRRFTNLVYLLIALVGLSACQRKIDRLSGGSAAAGFKLDATVPADQSALISQDISILNSLSLSPSSTDASTVGLNDFSGPAMVQWLRARVTYIVGESYEYSKQWKVAQANVNYPSNPYSPTAYARVGWLEPLNADGENITIMSNVGGSIYRTGKEVEALVSIPVAGENVVVVSPRTGIIKIGPGLFANWKVPNTPSDSYANSLLRIAVFFHEARHSDGNGSDVTFPHAMCQVGQWKGSRKADGTPSSLNDDYACEQYTNGPYAVDAVMMKLLKNSCTGCSNAEMNTMKALQADTEARLTYSARRADERPEAVK